MNRWKIIGALTIGCVVSVATASQAQADPFEEALDCAVLNGFACFHAQDAKNWSISVTDWKFKSERKLNTMADAFRHCTWIGALATRIGQQDAYRVGFAHEEYDSSRVEAESKMDDWNNFIGAGIGAAAVRSGTSDQWGYVLNECESRARSYQLYGLDGIKGNYA